jgi:hypothetical protein
MCVVTDECRRYITELSMHRSRAFDSTNGRVVLTCIEQDYVKSSTVNSADNIGAIARRRPPHLTKCLESRQCRNTNRTHAVEEY